MCIELVAVYFGLFGLLFDVGFAFCGCLVWLGFGVTRLFGVWVSWALIF